MCQGTVAQYTQFSARNGVSGKCVCKTEQNETMKMSQVRALVTREICRPKSVAVEYPGNTALSELAQWTKRATEG